MLIVGDAAVIGNVGNVAVHYRLVPYAPAAAVARDVLQLYLVGYRLGIGLSDFLAS
jgi:hypothetical protein